MASNAVFLDRDGVINVNHGYVHTKESFEFIEGIFDLALFATQKNYKIIVITNQAGIGRGYYTERQFQILSGWMCEKFTKVGARISRVYYSPYHPTAAIGKYLKDDSSRKPHPGMILKAQKDFSIDLSSSILIGDKSSDIIAGCAAGVGKNLLFSNECPMELKGIDYYQITKLQDAMHYINA
jgi:D-glycero-D-manno-heptose 1,7-bisphosphate phosphatase